MLPLAFDLEGRDVLVVGFGRVGAHKAGLLIDAGARVHVITREALVDPPTTLASVSLREYRPGDLAGHALVVSATGDGETNDLIVAEARSRGVPLNVVDDPSRCSVYFTSVARDGDVVVSVSTSGSAPALAQWVRRRLEAALPPGIGRVARTLRAERDAMHAHGLSTEVDWTARIEELLGDA